MVFGAARAVYKAKRSPAVPTCTHCDLFIHLQPAPYLELLPIFAVVQISKKASPRLRGSLLICSETQSPETSKLPSSNPKSLEPKPRKAPDHRSQTP